MRIRLLLSLLVSWFIAYGLVVSVEHHRWLILLAMVPVGGVLYYLTAWRWANNNYESPRYMALRDQLYNEVMEAAGQRRTRQGNSAVVSYAAFNQGDFAMLREERRWQHDGEDRLTVRNYSFDLQRGTARLTALRRYHVLESGEEELLYEELRSRRAMSTELHFLLSGWRNATPE